MAALSTIARVALGVAFLVAGLLKVGQLDQSLRAVRAYQLLPEVLERPVGYGVPYLEALLAMLLIVGLLTRPAAVVTALVLLAYIVAIASVAARGLRIDCGCFTAGGELPPGAPTHYVSDLVRDSITLVVAALVAWRPRSPLSVDHLLSR